MHACRYLWRKFAGPRWLARYGNPLQQFACGTLAQIETPGRVRVQLEIPCSARTSAQNLVAKFGGRIDTLPRDWQRRYAKTGQTKPLEIGKRLVVAGSKRSAREMRFRQETQNALIIPAAAAFGTGEHVTTAMCLRLLEASTRGWKNDWTLLDAGTGTGILALAGRCLGARHVLAIDDDRCAIATAEENARINRIGGVRFELADVLTYKCRKRFNVIVANLFSELLICALPGLKVRLKKNGLLILSGILRSQERTLLRAARSNGLSIVQIRRRGKWIAILCSGGL